MAVLTAIDALVNEISQRAGETERARGVPEDLARRLGSAGMFRLLVPPSIGGAGVDPMTACAVVEAVARADGSTGWTSMILNTTLFASWLEPDVAREMLATDPELGMAGIFSPIGQTEAAADGAVRLSGRFPFNSGSNLATWFCQGAFVGGDVGPPAWKFLFLPAADVEVLDTWYVAGLRGTASNDVSVSGALVPRERMANPLLDPAPHDDPQFRWSFFALLASLMSGVPLGIARRAIDELTELSQRKSRGGAEPLAAEQVTQLAVGEAESKLRAARCWMHDVLSAAWDTAVAGDPLSEDERVAIALAARHAMRTGVEVTDAMFRLAGGGALYEDKPLQRCWRDIHAGACHIFFSDNFARRPAQALLGQPVEWMMV